MKNNWKCKNGHITYQENEIMCLKCGEEMIYYPKPPEQEAKEWEKEFDQFFSSLDVIQNEMPNEAIKNFIRSNFIPKKELKPTRVESLNEFEGEVYALIKVPRADQVVIFIKEIDN